nr:unnamed protein product [Callosobruchus chinensis]
MSERFSNCDLEQEDHVIKRQRRKEEFYKLHRGIKKDVSAWNKQGLEDLKHIAERAKKHENSVFHIYACMDFSVLGKLI